MSSLDSPKLKDLSIDQAKDLIARYEAAPKPVTYQHAEEGGAKQHP